MKKKKGLQYVDAFVLLSLGVIGLVMALMLFGCTINISMAHTSGVASDVIDDTQSPATSISPNIELPLVGK